MRLWHLVGCMAALGWSVSAHAEDRIIKTVQPKRYTKMGRPEATVHLGAAVNDPFVVRYMLSGGIGLHLTEIFAIEGGFDFSPDLGRADWKPITVQLVDNNHVSPGISRWMWSGQGAMVLAPIHGKAAIRGVALGDFEVFGRFGMALVHTEDDEETLADEGALYGQATRSQSHLSSVYGGGVRLFFSQRTTLRLEARTVTYIETVEGGTLQMKNNLVLQAGVGWLLGR